MFGSRREEGYTITKMFDKWNDRKNFKLDLIDGAELVGRFGFPRLQKVKYVPRYLAPFHVLKTDPNLRHKCCHFFIDDYQFERLWNSPIRYLPLLKRCEGVIGPDFSMYSNMSQAQIIWNCYRNRVLTFWIQKNGIPAIPVLEWSSVSDFDFCFEGIPRGSVVALGLYGCMENNMKRFSLLQGFYRACEIVEPKTVIVYGAKIPEMETVHRDIRWFSNYCHQMKKRI